MNATQLTALIGRLPRPGRHSPAGLLFLFGLGVLQVLLTAPRGIYGQLEDVAAALRRAVA